MKNIKYIAFISIIILIFICAANICVFATETDIVDYTAIDKQIAEDVEKYHIPGMAVAVVNKDDILFEKTYGNCENINQPFIIGSMSKSFTALAVMQLTESGKINLDSSIDEYIDTSEWFAKNTTHSRITVKNLLNHTSGITTYQTFGSLKSTDSYGSFVYANANYGLLGLIIEAVSGMSYENYITQNIFEPLGMKHSSATFEKSKENGLIEGYRNYFGIPVAGEPDYPDKIIHKGMWTNIPAGYLSSSVTDMEKYLQMYIRGKDNIISNESIDCMFYDNVPADDGAYYYGMGWNYSTEMFNQPMLWHAGLVENYTSNMFIMPDKNIAVVVLVNMNDYLVGNNMLGNIVNPLLGEPKQELPNLYFILHTVIDAVGLAILFISIFNVVTLNKWKIKANNKQISVSYILCHIILPILLLSIPLIVGTPYKVIWLFVRDLAVMIVVNVIILIAVGGYKAVFLLKRSGKF